MSAIPSTLYTWGRGGLALPSIYVTSSSVPGIVEKRINEIFLRKYAVNKTVLNIGIGFTVNVYIINYSSTYVCMLFKEILTTIVEKSWNLRVLTK